MFALLEAERSSHAAAPGIEEVKIQPDFLEHRRFIFEPHDGAMMAVGMHQRLAIQLLDWVMRRVFLQKLT